MFNSNLKKSFSLGLLIVMFVLSTFSQFNGNLISNSDSNNQKINENPLMGAIPTNYYFDDEKPTLYIKQEKNSELFDFEFTCGVYAAAGITAGDYTFNIFNFADLDNCYYANGTSYNPFVWSWWIKPASTVASCLGGTTQRPITFNGKTVYYILNTTDTSSYIDSSASIGGSCSNYNSGGPITTLGSSSYANTIQFVKIYYSLSINLFLNSSFYNSGNIRIQTFDLKNQDWITQDINNIKIEHPQYKLRIYDLSNNLIYEDSSIQLFSYQRTIDIDSFRVQNNAGEPIVTNLYDTHGHYRGVESFTETPFNTEPTTPSGLYSYGTTYVVDNYQNHSNVLCAYGSETVYAGDDLGYITEFLEFSYVIENATNIEFWAYENLTYSHSYVTSICENPFYTQIELANYDINNFAPEGFLVQNMVEFTRSDSDFVLTSGSPIDQIRISNVFTSSKWYHYRFSIIEDYCLIYVDFQLIGQIQINTSIAQNYLCIYSTNYGLQYFDAFDWSTAEGYYVNRNKDLNGSTVILDYIENTPRYSGNDGYYQGALSFTEDSINTIPESIDYNSGTVYLIDEYQGHNQTLYSNGTQYDHDAEMDLTFFSIPLYNATEVSFWTYVNLSSQLDAYFYLSNVPMTSYADIESGIGLDFSFNRNNGDIEGPGISETIFDVSGWYHLRVAYIPISDGERIYTIYEDYYSQATVTGHTAANYDWNYLSVMVINNTYLDAIDYNTAANYFPDRNKLLNCSDELFTYLQTQPQYEFDWAGWYQGAYSFNNDTINTRPSNGIMSWSSGSYHVKADQNGHEKVISNLYNEANNAIRYDIEQNTDITNFEFWFYPNGADSLVFYTFSSIPTYKVLTWHDLSYLTDNQWYHIRFQFDYLNLQYKYYVNQNLVSTTNYADTPYGHIPESNNIYSIWFYTGANIQNYSIDAVDYSGADGYFINRNTLLNYSTDILTQVEATANYDRTGWYQGTYSFDSIEINTCPYTNVYPSTSSKPEIIKEFDGHQKVMNFTMGTIDKSVRFEYTVSSTIEYWLYPKETSPSGNWNFVMWNNIGTWWITSDLSEIYTWNTTDYFHESISMAINGWYHFRITIGSPNVSIYINNILAISYPALSATMDSLTIACGYQSADFYFDAFDCSSSPNFFINRNTLLNYSTALNPILEHQNYNHTGHYQGAYSYNSDLLHVNGITGAFTNSYIINEKEEHKKVTFYNQSLHNTYNSITLYDNPANLLSSFNIEYWYYTTDAYHWREGISFIRTGYDAQNFFHAGGNLAGLYNCTTTLWTPITINQWNHYRISFQNGNLTFYLNGIQTLTLNSYAPTFETIRLNYAVDDLSPSEGACWIDAIDASFLDSNYFINRNMLENQSIALETWNAYPNWESGYYQDDGTGFNWVYISPSTTYTEENAYGRYNIKHLVNPLTSANTFNSFWIDTTNYEFSTWILVENSETMIYVHNGTAFTFRILISTTAIIIVNDVGSAVFSQSISTAWQHIRVKCNNTTTKLYINNSLAYILTDIPDLITMISTPVTLMCGSENSVYLDAYDDPLRTGYFLGRNMLENTTASPLPMNYTAAPLILPTYESYAITYDSTPFAVTYETYDDTVLLSLQTNPYTYTLTNFTPAFYLYRVFDLYANELKSGALYEFEDELIYTPPNTRECFISLADQQNQYLDWENYKIYIEDNLIYSNRFYEEIGETVTIDIYSRFDTLLATTTHRVTRDQNWIPIELTRYTLKIYNQQANFIHYNITLDQVHYPAANIFWSEWLAPGEIGKNYLYPDYYSVTLMANESGTPSYVEYNLNFNTDDVLLISSSNTIFAVLQNINALNSSIDTQFTYVSLNFTNTNSQIGNQTTLITINFENINTTIDDMLLSQVWSFEFMNTSLGSLLLYSENSFEYINSTVGEMLQLEWNSFDFLNSSVEDIIVEQLNSFGFYNTSIATLLTQSQNSFTFLNSSLDSLFSAANNSFEFMNSSLGDLLLYNQNSFDFLNTSVGDLLLTTANSFDFINVTVGDLLLQSNNSFAYLNVTVGDIMVEMLNAFGFMNTSLEDLLLYSGNSFEFMNTSLEDLLMYSENSFEFMNVTLGDLLSASSNSFEFMNTSLGDLLLYSENSFEFMNVTLGDLLMNVENSFNFTNASLLDLILYSQNGFDFLNTSMGDLLLSTENSFGFMNVTLNDLLVSTANSFAFANTTMNDILMYTTNSFAYLNTTVQGIYLLSENSFLFTNSSLNQIIAQNYNGFEFLNSSVVSLYNIQENSFVFINSSVASLLTQSQNSFNYLNSSVSSIYGLSIMSFEFLNSSVQNMETTMAQNFTFLFSNISSNQLEVLTQFNIVNSNVTNNSMAILSQLYAVNSSITDLILNLESNVLLVNDSIYTAILNVSTALALDNNNILGNISITYQQNEFLTELFKKTMFSDLLNWSGVGYNYSLIENQIDTVQFANQFKNDTLQLFLRYQNRVESMILTSQTSIDQMLPNEDVEYRVKSLTTGDFLNEWEPIENKSINIGYYEEIIPATPEDIRLEIKDYLMLALFGVVAFSAMALLYFRSKIDLENSVESKKEKPSKKTPITRDTRKLFFSEPEPYRPKKSTKVGSSLGGVLAVIIIVFVIVYLMIHFGV